MATVPQHIQCLPTPMRERTSQRHGETNGSLPLTTICSSILTHRCELAHLDWASLSSNYNTKRRETNTTNPITEDLFLEQSPTIVIILRFFHARYRTILSLASNSSSTQTTRQHKNPRPSLSSHLFPSSPVLATYTHYHKFSTKASRTFNPQNFFSHHHQNNLFFEMASTTINAPRDNGIQIYYSCALQGIQIYYSCALQGIQIYYSCSVQDSLERN